MAGAFGSFEAVLFDSVADPAVDMDAMTERVECADGVKRTRGQLYSITYKPEFLPLKPGAKPMRFELQPLRQRVVNALVVDPQTPSPDELWQLVSASLVAVNDPTGALSFADEDRHKPDANKVRALKEDAMERLAQRIGILGVRELGKALLVKATLPEWAYDPFVSAAGLEASSSKTG
jgi:hypothetical protein